MDLDIYFLVANLYHLNSILIVQVSIFVFVVHFVARLFLFLIAFALSVLQSPKQVAEAQSSLIYSNVYISSLASFGLMFSSVTPFPQTGQSLIFYKALLLTPHPSLPPQSGHSLGIIKCGNNSYGSK